MALEATESFSLAYGGLISGRRGKQRVETVRQSCCLMGWHSRLWLGGEIWGFGWARMAADEGKAMAHLIMRRCGGLVLARRFAP